MGDGQSQKALALAALDRIGESERELSDIRARAARGEGRPGLEAPPHLDRVQALYQSETVEMVELPATMVAMMDQLAARDLLSCREEFIEKALAAYIAEHPRGTEDLPKDWQTTVASARDEVEGRTQGAFGPGFTAALAAVEQREQHRQGSGRDTARGRDDGRGNE